MAGLLRFRLNPDGSVRTVWTDRVALRELGHVTVFRASNVEFDTESQLWIATRPDGSELARGPNREAVIEAEVEILQQEL